MEMLTTAQAAEVLGVHKKTLARWRAGASGPRWVRVEGVVRYRRSDLEAYIASRLRPAKEERG